MSLKIEKAKAKKLYPESPEWFRTELVEAFGEECFKKRSFTDIKTFEDACDELGISKVIFTGAESTDEAAYMKLKVIARAINQGWVPDWTNEDQRKWFPYFVLSSGFGFSYSYYYFTSAITGVGSRLCFESEEQASYAGKQFVKLYEEFLTLK